MEKRMMDKVVRLKQIVEPLLRMYVSDVENRIEECKVEMDGFSPEDVEGGWAENAIDQIEHWEQTKKMITEAQAEINKI